MNIVIIDYGLGNLTSVYNALKFLKATPKISQSPVDIDKADKIVLPGVGAFGDAVAGLEERSITGSLKKALSSGKPYLGICLGLQILFEESEEGHAKGFGLLEGKVKRFSEKSNLKVPQIGWNRVKFQASRLSGREGDSTAQITDGIGDNAYFYFDHSYYAEPADKLIIAGLTGYGVDFPSIIKKDNILAVQFHPERSQAVGLKFLENFVKL